MKKTLGKFQVIGISWHLMATVACLAMVFVGLVGLVTIASAATADKSGGLPVLTSVKLVEKQYFHQLELVFEGRPRFSMQQKGGKFFLKLRNIDNSSLPTAPSATSLLSQLPTTVAERNYGTSTSIVVGVVGGFRTEMSAYEKPGLPFRIVIEFYATEKKPAKVVKSAVAGKSKKKVAKVKAETKATEVKDFWSYENDSQKKVVKKVKKVKTKKKVAKRPKKILAKPTTFIKIERVTQTGEERGVAAFNNGWRWEYRKKVVASIRDTHSGVYNDVLAALGDKLGLIDVAEPGQLVSELILLVADYESGLENDKAEVLKGIIPFFQGKGSIEKVDALLRKYAYTGFTRLGRFVEGVYYEKRGFIPEALAHYSMTVVGREDEDIPEPFTNVVIAEANFRMGVVYFMEYKMEEAANHFKRASLQGSNSARKWLANTLLIKGRVKDARLLFKGVEANDPVTRLSLADISVLDGDFEAARKYYSDLSDDFSGDALVSAYFMIRIADTYQIQGDVEYANRKYKIARDNLSGDGRAMASLAMAELLIGSDDHEAYRDALRYYGTVAEGNYIGTEEAYLMSARLHMQLGNYNMAIALIDKMDRLFPLGGLRFDASRVRGEVTLRWLDRLASIGDDEGFAKIFLTYEPFIPFGKKSGAYIQAGRAFMKLGFTTDAVKVLNSLVKMGKGKHLEESMVLLAKGYLAQEDIESADRLARFFKTSFPKTKFKNEFAKIVTEINYRKGEFKKVVDTREVKRRSDWDNTEEMMVVASSFFKLNNYKKAEERYRRAAELLAAAQENDRLADACMGVAESSFMQGKYKESIKFYRCAVELSKVRDGDGGSIDSSWATYRLAESNFRIGKSYEGEEALETLRQTDEKMAEWGKYLFAENGN